MVSYRQIGLVCLCFTFYCSFPRGLLYPQKDNVHEFARGAIGRSSGGSHGAQIPLVMDELTPI